MQTVLNRAGGAIPRLFVYLGAALIATATPALADFGGNFSRRTVTASWYGPGFDGRLTASGQRFDARGLTAAHKTLPFVLVTVTDRGPYCGRRELDLSRAAAREVGILARGVAPVVVEIL